MKLGEKLREGVFRGLIEIQSARSSPDVSSFIAVDEFARTGS